MRRANSGFSIVEVMVASVVAVTLAVVLSKFSAVVTSSNVALRDEGTISSLRQEMSAVGNDLSGWFEILKSYSSYSSGTQRISKCLVPGGPTLANCPTACTVSGSNITCGSVTFSDLALKTEATGQRLSGIDLYDLNGQKFAGAPDAPVYLDANGAPCPAAGDPQPNPLLNRNCKFTSVGFMLINQTASGVPAVVKPTVSFVRKIEQTALALQSGATPMQPNYDKVVLGLFWRDLQGNGPDPGVVFSYSGKLTITAGNPCDIPELPGFCIAHGATLTVSTIAGSTLLAHQKLCLAIHPGGPCSSGSTFTLPDMRGYFVRGGNGTAAGALATWPTAGTPTLATDYPSHSHAGGTSTLSGGITTTVHPSMSTTASMTSGFSAVGLQHMGATASGPFGTRELGPQIFPYGTFYAGSVSPAVGTTVPGGTVTVTSITPQITVSMPPSSSMSTSAAYNVSTEVRPSNAAVYYIIRDDYL